MRAALGIDIGTTTVCCIAVDVHSGKVLKSDTLSNDAFISACAPWEKIQDCEAIAEKVLQLAESYIEVFQDIAAIGITGQMHGILYLDQEGRSVSPLYTWQDGRGNLPVEDTTYAGRFSELTGIKAATGYGLVTHFYNLENGLVPPQAVKIATIHDYIAMRLCGLQSPVTHVSDAASLGAFNIAQNEFDFLALERLGIDGSILPAVTSEAVLAGYCKGIPVSVAIGDNQASFIGSVQDEDPLLINVGTGSQVSMLTDRTAGFGDWEIRPLYGTKRIAVGACLCGGKAYAVLSDFFAQVGKELFGVTNAKLYDAMDDLACDEAYLEVDTRFSGTRVNPQQRGAVKGIGVDNFTPSALITGTLAGMAQELELLYRQMKPHAAQDSRIIVGSGNGIRMNKPLCRIVEKKFGMPLIIPEHREEAAFGAVLFALAASGEYPDIASAQRTLIQYMERII